jgi:hypothetical protein
MHRGARRSNARCDFCRDPRSPAERRRFVWHTEADGELVLAELCDRCATHADRLLALHGGRGLEAISLRSASTAAAVESGRVRTVGGTLVRGVVYVLIGLAAFVLVTLLTARG